MLFICSVHRLAHLENKVPVPWVSKTEFSLVQMCPELRQILILAADVCGQDYRSKSLLHVHSTRHQGKKHIK